MKRRIFRIARGFLLILPLLAPSGMARAQREDPESSPLSCALYFGKKLDPENGIERDGLLTNITKIYWLTGKPAQSLQVAREIKCDERAYISNYLAAQAIKAGQQEYARRLIAQSLTCSKDEDFYQKGKVFNDFIATLLELQQYDQALAVAESIEDETSSRALALTTLADAYIEAEQSTQALEMLARALAQAQAANEEHSDETCEALGKIAAGYARLGEQNQAAAALSFAAQLAEQENDSYRERVKSIVATGYARAGQDGQALSLAESLGAWKTDTLINIASIDAVGLFTTLSLHG